MNFLLYLLLAPLNQLYFKGPSIGGFGFWHGAAPEDICSELTDVPAGFWSGHIHECEMLLHQRFVAFVIGSIWIVGLVAILKTFNLFVHYYFVTRPLLQFIRSGPRWDNVGPNVPKIKNGATSVHDTTERPSSSDKTYKNMPNSISCNAVE